MSRACASPEDMRAGALTPFPISPTAVRKKKPFSLPGKHSRGGFGDVSEVDLDTRVQEQENSNGSLLFAALDELAEAVWKNLFK